MENGDDEDSHQWEALTLEIATEAFGPIRQDRFWKLLNFERDREIAAPLIERVIAF